MPKYLLAIYYIAMENGPVEIVSSPMKDSDGGPFQFAMWLFTRGHPNFDISNQ